MRWIAPSEKDTAFASLENLRRTRDLLLPHLLSGQIDMKAIDHA